MEYLIDYALELPELPEHLVAERDQMEQVHECQTPVFLQTERKNGSVDFHFDIPKESPTVRGYAGVLVDGFDGATPEEVLATPDDVYILLKLQDVITPQRLRGLHFLMHYMKRQVEKLLNE
ncbi:SufE family protein [Chloroflexi bacterium TSY]|nr:SufE family protein [Chloroflexi bacterium TSY]